MDAMSRSPACAGAGLNSEICSAPASRNALIAGARNAVTQSSPAAARSAVIGAWVIMPRSPRIKSVG
jgi:hypothetical protein